MTNKILIFQETMAIVKLITMRIYILRKFQISCISSSQVSQLGGDVMLKDSIQR